MGNKSKKNSKSSFGEILKSIKGGVVFFYLLVILVVHVYYAPDHFFYLGNHKTAFYERVTSVFLAVSLLLLLVSIVLYLKNKKHDKWKPDPVEIIVLAYAGWNVVSFLSSPYRDGALKGYEGWNMGLLTQLAMFAAFLFVARWAGSGKKLLMITAAAFLPQCIMIILQRLGMDPFHMYTGINIGDWNRRNMLGTIGNSNWLCGYMVCIIPVVIWFFLFETKWFMEIIWGVILFAALSALMLQGSSSGVVALAGIWVVCLLFVIKTYKQLLRLLAIPLMICFFWTVMTLGNVMILETEEGHMRETVYSMLWIIPTVLLALLIAGLWAVWRKKKDEALPSAFTKVLRILAAVGIGMGVIAFIVIQFMGDSSPSAIVRKLQIKDSWGSYRVLVWKETIVRFFTNTNPKSILFGVGPDSYGYWFGVQGITIPIEGPMKDSVFTNAHNIFLTALVNTGIIGLLLYISAFFAALFSFIRNRKESLWAVLGILLMVGTGVNGFFSFEQICAMPAFLLLVALARSEMNSEKAGNVAKVG